MSPRARLALRAAVALALALAAPLYVFGLYFPTFISADRPIPLAACGRSPLPPRPAPGSLTVVVVDGLGFDEAEQASELAWLRARSVSRPLVVPFPSYTTPALLSFATGLGPRDSGVRINGRVDVVTSGLDNLVQVARDAGRPRNLFDGGWRPLGSIFFAGADLHGGRLAAAAAPLKAPAAGELRLLYQGYVDRAGHEHGRDSEAYRQARRAAARYLQRVVAGLDPRRDSLLVVSDHGHLARGGHGGAEPDVRRAWLVASGPDLRRGVTLGARPLRDVSATAAVLAGLSTPGCNLGRPMLDLLELPPAPLARALAGPFDQAARLSCALEPGDGCEQIPPLGAALGQGSPAAVAPAERLLVALDVRREHAIHESGWRARWWRVGLVSLLSLLLAAAMAWRPSLRVRGRLAQLAPVVLLAVYSAALALQGYGASFSKMPSQAQFSLHAAIAGALAAMAAVAVCLFEQRRTTRSTGAEVALLAGVAVPFALLAAYAGADPWQLAPPTATTVVLLAAPTLVAAAAAALLVLLVGLGREGAPPLGGARARRKLVPQPDHPQRVAVGDEVDA